MNDRHSIDELRRALDEQNTELAALERLAASIPDDLTVQVGADGEEVFARLRTIGEPAKSPAFHHHIRA